MDSVNSAENNPPYGSQEEFEEDEEILEFGCDFDVEDLPRFSVSHIHNPVTNSIDFFVHDSYEHIAEILDNCPEFIPERPADCICSDKSFDVYGCLCRRRIMPG